MILHRSFNGWRTLNYSLVGITLIQSSAKRYYNYEINNKPILRSTNAKHVLHDKNYMTCTYNINIRIHSIMKAQMFINRLMSYLPKTPPLHLAKDKALARMKTLNWCWKKASMIGFSIINVPPHHGMRVGTMKQSCAEDFIAQKKKGDCLSIAIQWLLLDVISLTLTFIIPWMISYVNQVNGFSLWKKDRNSFTVINDGHCCNVQTS